MRHASRRPPRAPRSQRSQSAIALLGLAPAVALGLIVTVVSTSTAVPPVAAVSTSTAVPTTATVPLTALPLASAVQRATAAADDVFTKPRYLPFRGSAKNGCVVSNCTADGKPDHGYWALDFSANRGDPVYAAGGGIAHIEKAADPGRCVGGTVWIDHGGGDTSRYVHLAVIRVGEGQVVDQNTSIGTFGGDSCGAAALHFSVRPNGPRPVKEAIDPGELRACWSNSYPVTYPAVLGFGNWNDIPFQSRTISNQGADCWSASDQAGAPRDVRLTFKKKGLGLSWQPAAINPQLVISYKIGYRHISRAGKWTKQRFVTVGAGIRSALVRHKVLRTKWEAVVWSYDESGASTGVVKRATKQ